VGLPNEGLLSNLFTYSLLVVVVAFAASYLFLVDTMHSLSLTAAKYSQQSMRRARWCFLLLGTDSGVLLHVSK
jgi:hypothetical protein